MLNLLRFRATADYSATPHLAPKAPISGEDAYRLYMEHTRPHLKNAGGEIRFLGRGGKFLIGPSDERWDAAMLVSQASPAAFLAFASNPEYLSGMGHRVAALEDSRWFRRRSARRCTGPRITTGRRGLKCGLRDPMRGANPVAGMSCCSFNPRPVSGNRSKKAWNGAIARQTPDNKL